MLSLQPDAPPTRRVPVAVVCHTLPPYRLHAHQRYATEIPEIRLLTVNTHHDTTRNWQVSIPDSIGLVDLSEGDTMQEKSGWRGWLREWRRGGDAIRCFEREQVAAVVVNGYNDPGRIRIIRWCRRHGVPCFLWGDGNIASDRQKRGWRQRVKNWFIPWVVRHCTGCFGCGRLGRGYWEAYGARPDQIFIAPYEPDYDLIQHIQPEEVAAIRRKYGLSTERRYFVYSGRLTAVKRVDLLLQAFQSIAAQRENWDLVIVGDGELRTSLGAQVSGALADRVVWTGFLGDQADVSKIYRACDVLVLPSEFEPWALVVNEAAAAGMAIVATDVVGAAAELVVADRNGQIVPAGDAAALEQALLAVSAGDAIDTLKQASQEVLAEWRERGDPVAGLRAALVYAGVLTNGKTSAASRAGVQCSLR